MSFSQGFQGQVGEHCLHHGTQSRDQVSTLTNDLPQQQRHHPCRGRHVQMALKLGELKYILFYYRWHLIDRELGAPLENVSLDYH